MLSLRPIGLRAANDWMDGVHRHNGRTARNGGKFAISVIDETGEVVGVAIAGNPLASGLMDGYTLEVLRVCTRDGAPKNVCSMLYSACWRAWRAMGGQRIITYTLASEAGTSLKASGWKLVAEVEPHKNGWHRGDHLDAPDLFGQSRRTLIPVMLQPKLRWEASNAPDS